MAGKSPQQIGVRDNGVGKEVTSVHVRDNGNGHSVSDSDVYVETDLDSCPIPINLSATAQLDGSVVLNGSSPGSPSNGFELQYNLFGAWNIVSDTISGTASQFTHDGCGTDYPSGSNIFYRIRGQCSSIDSAGSNESNTVSPTC